MHKHKIEFTAKVVWVFLVLRKCVEALFAHNIKIRNLSDFYTIIKVVFTHIDWRIHPPYFCLPREMKVYSSALLLNIEVTRVLSALLLVCLKKINVFL